MLASASFSSILFNWRIGFRLEKLLSQRWSSERVCLSHRRSIVASLLHNFRLAGHSLGLSSDWPGVFSSSSGSRRGSVESGIVLVNGSCGVDDVDDPLSKTSSS